MIFLKADTNVEVLIGPAVAVGDGFTPVTTLSLSTADEAEIIKYNGATGLVVTSISANTMTAITNADGYYTLDLTTGNVDTEGFLVVLINDDSLILPIRHEFMVVNANVYDALFAASGVDLLDVNVAQWLGTAAATPTVAGVPEVDVTHQGGGAIPAPAVTGVPDVNVTHVGDTLQTAGDIIGDTNDIQTRLPAALVSGRMDSNVSAIDNDADALKQLRDNIAVSARCVVDNGTFTATTTQAQIDLMYFGDTSQTLEATNDHFKDRVILPLTGANRWQGKRITAYDGTNKRFTFDAMVEAMADNDEFLVI